MKTPFLKNYAKKVDVQKKRRDRIEKKKDLKRQTEKNIVKKKLHGSLLLFTKHFDARTKLSSHSSHTKRPLLPKREESLRRSVIDSPKKTVISRHIQPKHNNERQSIFTGKSIKVVAKNTTQCSLLDSPSTEKSPFTTSKLVKSNNQSNVTENRKQSLAAKVVVTNLHPNVTDDDIKELFGVLGDLRRASLTGLGSAEVIYKNTDDAFAAYSKYHGRNLDGQPMILKLTTTDENDMNNSGIIGRSSRHSQSAMQHYVPPPRLQSTKPVVFTVKL
ncbi:uncharacterized protein LOC100205695 isoform X2 [Hydra vulgaris]|uniref:Uncharacterized protein LOC100205695 isoform X2 n=1 Tax=Hydra vulgaris TaxID=6087 RepID=A0ABM4CCB5_HYDVU